jgi:hypothetical protein
MDVKTVKMMVGDPDVDGQISGVQLCVVFGREAPVLSKAEWTTTKQNRKQWD